MTIEERAILNLQYEKDFLGRNLSDDMVCRAYVKGATDQKAIDIDKACEWLKNNWREYVNQDRDGMILFGHWEPDFRKAMEEKDGQD